MRISCNEMTISIVIPTYNRIDSLNKCLNSIIAQTKLPNEVIVVDDYSDKDVAFHLVKAKEKEFKNAGISLKIIRNSRAKGVALARNSGIDASSGEIIFFLDDDIILERDYIKNILNIYCKRENCLGVTGYVGNSKLNVVKNSLARLFYLDHLENNSCRTMPSTFITYPYNLDEPISCQWFTGGSQSYRRSILSEFRFDENLRWYCWKDDLDLSFRIYKNYPGSLFIDPSAKYQHKASNIGKPPSKELIYMKQIYELYFFFKNIEQNSVNRAIFALSRIGFFIVELMNMARDPQNYKLISIAYLILAYATCIFHMKEIWAQNLDFFNIALEKGHNLSKSEQ